jgi:hypothetical protein
MILSYSLDAKQLPLDILFFNFDVFISFSYNFSYHSFPYDIKYDFFNLSHNPDLVAEFIPKTWHIWDKWRKFLFYFHTIPLLGFCTKR